MSKPFGFFRDSDGNRSYGRLASFLLTLGGIIAALLGKDYGAMLTAALGFYATSKAQQAYTEGKNGTKGSASNPGEAGSER